VAVKLAQFYYDSLDRPTTTTMQQYTSGTGWKTAAEATYTFDNASRLTGLTYTKGANTLAGYTWQFDNAGRVTQFVSTLDGTADYSYDDTNQLTGADYDYQTDEAYTYDANGNRTNTGYTTGTNNQMTSDGTYRYQYDAEGNRTARFVDNNSNGLLDSGDTDITEYTWDYRNRLTVVTERASYGGTATKVTEFAYDYLNRLVSESADPDGGGEEGAEETYFAYDGGQVLLRFDGSETGDLVDRYMWGPAVDYLLSDEQLTSPTTPGTVYWALTDNLNTVRDLALYDFGTDTTSVANHRVYDAYGNLTDETNAAVDCLFGYTGRQFDEATGLQNNLNRWYDPRVGRWLSEDPIGYAGADANLYRYVRNSLTNAVDPLGLASPRETPRPLVLLIQQYGGRIPRANWEGFCRDQKIGLTTEQSIQLNRGCTGFCAIAQADNPRKGPYEVFPENREGTICYRTEREARNRTCEAKKGEQNFVFAKTGEWKRGEPEKGREGPIPNDSVVGKRSGELNESMRQWLDELEDTYGWRPYPQTGYYNYWTYAYGVYFSMDQASKYGDQYVIIKYAPPEVKGTAIMWCSTCRRPR